MVSFYTVGALSQDLLLVLFSDLVHKMLVDGVIDLRTLYSDLISILDFGRGGTIWQGLWKFEGDRFANVALLVPISTYFCFALISAFRGFVVICLYEDLPCFFI